MKIAGATVASKGLALTAIALLLVTNLVTGFRLHASIQRWHDLDTSAARMAVGQMHEAGWDLEPVTGPSETDGRDRVLRALMKLETAYFALYELELHNQLPGGGRTWSMSVNVIQGPLRNMLISGDYSDLPTVKQRLRKLVELIPLDQRDPLAELLAAQKRLDVVFE